MFVVLVHYLVPIEVVDQHLAAHRAWLEGLYKDGQALVSGRRAPAVGGVVIVRGDDESAIAALFARDPFALAGVARHEILAFTPTPLPVRSPEAEAFLGRS
jgi:uncharacterized protein YciI